MLRVKIPIIILNKVFEDLIIRKMMSNTTAKSDKKLANVLLVEDNSENKDVISYFIKNICTVEHAPDGPTAIEMASSKNYDLILMDINLGLGINGMEATRQIRKIPGYAQTPIVAVTAYAMVGDREIFMEAGCTHYISKPFTKQEIVELINRILEEPQP